MGAFSLSNVVCAMMGFFDWTSYALIYQTTDNGGCFAFQEDLEVNANDIYVFFLASAI